MFFAAPLALLGLLGLPFIAWLLRLNPPAPRRIKFPPLIFLQNLAGTQRTSRKMPLWLLLFRLAATAVIIIGLAGPSLHSPSSLPGTGPILIVIDNGWASAADWPQRQDAAKRLLSGANSRSVAILATAPDASGAAPRILGLMTGSQAAQIIDALAPQPWPVDRIAATRALQSAPNTTRIYIADGITDGPGFDQFIQALNPVRIIANPRQPSLLLPPHLNPGGALTEHLVNPPPGASLLAKSATGALLLRAPFDADGDATVSLPPALINKLAALTLDSPATAATTQLLDGSTHIIIAGLTAGSAAAETPYLGPLYFIRRALPSGSQVITGDLAGAIAGKASVIIQADSPLSPAEQLMAQSWISQGGVLIRFAGPVTAATPDPLSPDPLLPGDRRLGGALSWASPQAIAPFPASSPFAGLPPDPTATISRQILADPITLDPATVWASLNDGTPLVLGKQTGKGDLIAILTTANADWASLALSGLYPAMLARLIAISEGGVPRSNLALPLLSSLSASGVLLPASGTAVITSANLLGITVSPTYPPGIYSSGTATLALNLGGHIPHPAPAPLPGALPLSGQPAPVGFGPGFLAAGIMLLVIDLLISLTLRGLLKTPALAIVTLLPIPIAAHAQTPALQTAIGYILTGDAATDQISADGLGYLSADVSAHTSAQLGNPIGLNPATDDLAFFPLIYWPVLPGAPAPAPAACTALIDYMAHGGLLVIDTPGSDPGAPGSGSGFAPGVNAARANATACLALPPLEPLTGSNVLAHCFYILHEFPGRFTGAPVLIATAGARDADGITPVIIGQNDWAAAWARDASGSPEETPIPGGEDQRVLADRFGTNLVIYALTGSYKADQASAPALLEKLGQ